MIESGSKLRAVVDANLVVSAQISRTTPPAQVLDAWLTAVFTLATSEDLLRELGDVLTRPRLRQRYGIMSAEIEQLLAAMRAGVGKALPLSELPLHCRDPKDDKVLAAALGANADYIVTGDDDLLSLDGHPALGDLPIVTPVAFLQPLDASS